MKIKLLLCLAPLGLLSIAACQSKKAGSSKDSVASVKDSVKNPGSINDIRPAGSPPAWGPDIRPQMQAVIEKIDSYGDKPVLSLSPAEARKNHTIKNAVDDLMKQYHIPLPVYDIDTAGKEIPVKGGTIHISMYTPRKGKGPFPVIVYFHAGGFVVASIEVYSASAKILADKVGAVVISVGYRLAPEHKFPTAHNDAYEAYLWAVKNAGAMKGDPKKIALAGESAGGNLAIATAIKARDERATKPTAILAIYPIAGSDTMTASYIKYANAKPLSRPLMIWFTKKYLNNMAEAKDPRNDLLHANLKGLPQTTVITDEIDPLQSEGLALVAKLKAAGVSTASRNYNGVTHEFFGFGEIIPEAQDAETFAVDRLRKAFRQ